MSNAATTDSDGYAASSREESTEIDAWYCAGWSTELASRPIGRKILGRRVVLFRDAEGVAHALGARCPHRGADLARGTVADGCVQCPFHGWRFDGSGRCVLVPSQPAGVKISPLARVPAFPLHEAQGMLWIWMSATDRQAKPPSAEPLLAVDETARRIFFAPQLIEAPFLNVVENAFDRAHVPFIHAGTFGPDQDPLVTRQRITADPDGCGFSAEDDADSPWRAAPRVPKGWVGLLGRLLGLREPIAQKTRFHAAGLVQIHMEYPNGTYDLFTSHITPADTERTWLFVESARTRAAHRLGDWIQRRVVGRVFEEGKLETSLILAADSAASVLSVESDRVGLAARRLCQGWADRVERLVDQAEQMPAKT